MAGKGRTSRRKGSGIKRNIQRGGAIPVPEGSSTERDLINSFLIKNVFFIETQNRTFLQNVNATLADKTIQGQAQADAMTRHADTFRRAVERFVADALSSGSSNTIQKVYSSIENSIKKVADSIKFNYYYSVNSEPVVACTSSALQFLSRVIVQTNSLAPTSISYRAEELTLLGELCYAYFFAGHRLGYTKEDMSSAVSSLAQLLSRMLNQYYTIKETDKIFPIDLITPRVFRNWLASISKTGKEMALYHTYNPISPNVNALLNSKAFAVVNGQPQIDIFRSMPFLNPDKTLTAEMRLDAKLLADLYTDETWVPPNAAPINFAYVL